MKNEDNPRYNARRPKEAHIAQNLKEIKNLIYTKEFEMNSKKKNKTQKSGINCTEQGSLCQLLITRKNIRAWENCNICSSIEIGQTKTDKTINKINNIKEYVPECRKKRQKLAWFQ